MKNTTGAPYLVRPGPRTIGLKHRTTETVNVSALPSGVRHATFLHLQSSYIQRERGSPSSKLLANIRGSQDFPAIGPVKASTLVTAGKGLRVTQMSFRASNKSHLNFHNAALRATGHPLFNV